MLELANAYKQLQQWEKAEGMYKALVAIEEKSPDQKGLVSALFEYGNMYFTMGKYVDAEPLLERSVSLQNGIDAQHVNKQMLTEYAKTLYKLNKVAQADEVYKQLRSSQ
jgi:tetratricopeptide (TPR) repeat protein